MKKRKKKNSRNSARCACFQKKKKAKENRRVRKKRTKKKYQERISFFFFCSRTDETGICFKVSWQKWGQKFVARKRIIGLSSRERGGWKKFIPVTGVNTWEFKVWGNLFEFD